MTEDSTSLTGYLVAIWVATQCSLPETLRKLQVFDEWGLNLPPGYLVAIWVANHCSFPETLRKLQVFDD